MDSDYLIIKGCPVVTCAADYYRLRRGLPPKLYERIKFAPCWVVSQKCYDDLSLWMTQESEKASEVKATS